MRKINKSAMIRRAALPLAAAAVIAGVTATSAGAVETVPLGTVLSDSVFVSGPGQIEDGTLTFELFLLPPSGAVECIDSNRVFLEVIAVDGTLPIVDDRSFTSGPYQTDQSGLYQWVATYVSADGDIFVSGVCGDPREQVNVVAGTELNTEPVADPEVDDIDEDGDPDGDDDDPVAGATD